MMKWTLIDDLLSPVPPTARLDLHRHAGSNLESFYPFELSSRRTTPTFVIQQSHDSLTDVVANLSDSG
jgi:hypothetical protein